MDFQIIILIAVVYLILLILEMRATARDGRLVEAHFDLLVRVDSKVGLFGGWPNREVCRIRFQKWLRTPTAPVPGTVYDWKQSHVETQKVLFRFPDEWQILAPTLDLSATVIESDEELQQRLMEIYYEQGWEFDMGEMNYDLEQYMRQHAQFWERHRDRLSDFIEITIRYRCASVSFLGYWRDRVFDSALRAAIFEARDLWNEMPSLERDKLPEGLRKAYYRNCV